MATSDNSTWKVFIVIPQCLSGGNFVTPSRRLWSRSALLMLMLMLNTLFACSTGTLAQVCPGQAPEIGTYAAAHSREALEEHSFALLMNILEKTESVATFRFDRPCFKCKDISLEVKDILPFLNLVTLSKGRAAETKRLLASKDSFVPFVIKSCIPQRLTMPAGFILYQSGAVSIFLVFPECQMARLVLETESPPYFFNVDPIYHEHPDFLQDQPK